jgi:hypothetical protein
MKEISTAILHFLIFISIGHYSQRHLNTFAVGYRNCVDPSSFRSVQRITAASTLNVNPCDSKSMEIKHHSRQIAMGLQMGEFSSNEIVGTSNQSSDIETVHLDNRESGRPERFLEYPELEIIEFEGILNFRSALPGTGLPIYRCAALDNATASDTERLLTPGWLKSDKGSTASNRCSITSVIRVLNTFFFNVFHLLFSQSHS